MKVILPTGEQADTRNHSCTAGPCEGCQAESAAGEQLRAQVNSQGDEIRELTARVERLGSLYDQLERWMAQRFPPSPQTREDTKRELARLIDSDTPLGQEDDTPLEDS